MSQQETYARTHFYQSAKNEEQEEALLELQSILLQRFVGMQFSIAQIEFFFNLMLGDIKSNSLCLYP